MVTKVKLPLVDLETCQQGEDQPGFPRWPWQEGTPAAAGRAEEQEPGV